VIEPFWWAPGIYPGQNKTGVMVHILAINLKGMSVKPDTATMAKMSIPGTHNR